MAKDEEVESYSNSKTRNSLDLTRSSNQSTRVIGRYKDTLETIPSKDEGEDS